MKKSRDNYIDDLVSVAFKLDDNFLRQKEKSKELQRMAQLARAGEKDSEEFKTLDRRYKNPTVIDSSNEWEELHRIVTQLR